jgi:hypothetical protein
MSSTQKTKKKDSNLCMHFNSKAKKCIMYTNNNMWLSLKDLRKYIMYALTQRHKMNDRIETKHGPVWGL